MRQHRERHAIESCLFAEVHFHFFKEIVPVKPSSLRVARDDHRLELAISAGPLVERHRAVLGHVELKTRALPVLLKVVLVELDALHQLVDHKFGVDPPLVEFRLATFLLLHGTVTDSGVRAALAQVPAAKYRC